MSVEFLLVSYSKNDKPEDRTVLADGNSVGVTNHILMLPADEYEISLEGSGYAPKSQNVTLAGTSIMRPKVITFT